MTAGPVGPAAPPLGVTAVVRMTNRTFTGELLRCLGSAAAPAGPTRPRRGVARPGDLPPRARPISGRHRPASGLGIGPAARRRQPTLQRNAGPAVRAPLQAS